MPMTTPPELKCSDGAHATPDGEILARVYGLLSSFIQQDVPVERRREIRHPFPHLIQLTPVGRDGITPEGESVVVAGKDISEHGLGFFHPKPLPYRRMIVSIETPNEQWVSFLVDLRWCRFTRQGWYESGGRFLKPAPSPMDDKSARQA